MSQSNVGGSLSTHAILNTEDGKQINLGILDKRTGIKLDLFGKRIDLTFPWTPRLWFYKYITYRVRVRKLNKKEG